MALYYTLYGFVYPQPDDVTEAISVLLPLPKPAPNPNPPEETVIKWQPPSIDWDPWRCRSAFREDDPYSQMDQVVIIMYFSIITQIIHKFM